ncbi:MAG: hypothetical protein QXU82_01275 [Candidatus Aenigmatarchaeota archaeon]
MEKGLAYYREELRSRLERVGKEPQLEDFPDMMAEAAGIRDEATDELKKHDDDEPARRLAAAQKLAKKGYEVRLRIDPIVPVDG